MAAKRAATSASKIGPFLIERRLGVGGMAEVFLAKKPLGSTFKHVVVKRMHSDLMEDERFVEMFLREAGILAQLNHGNVIQIFDLGTADDGHPYFAMEYLEGVNVHDLALRAWRTQRPLPVELVLRVLAEAARGLDYVHKKRGTAGEPLGLVHRDVAPDNLFFVKDGTVKLLDFGVARGNTMKVLTARGEVKGKLPFMAPEALEGLTLDARADLFSLGVCGYWLLTGRRPFSAEDDTGLIRAILRTQPKPASSSNADVPAWLDDLLTRMLDKDRAARTQSGAEVEHVIVKNAGTQLDRARDVAFVDDLFGLTLDDFADVDQPMPAVRRQQSGVFARVNALMTSSLPRSGSSVRGPRPITMVDEEPLFVDDGDVEPMPDSGAAFEPPPATTQDAAQARRASSSLSFAETTERARVPSPVLTTTERPTASPVPLPVAAGDANTAPRTAEGSQWSTVESPPAARVPRSSPMPRAVHVDMPVEADDPSGDTVRLTESQLGLLVDAEKKK